MPHAVELPPPRDWQVFEDFCRDLFAAEWGDPETQKHGRLGQQQQGLDVFGLRKGRWQGVQCKRKRVFPESRLTEKEVRAEVQAAYAFSRPIETLVLATTAPPDAKIQNLAAKLTDDHAQARVERKRFRVVVLGWSELCERLRSHPDVFDSWSQKLLGRPQAPGVEEPPERGTENSRSRLRVFICYARKDGTLREDLYEHLALLRREGRISIWHDQDIGAGDNWHGRIHQQLETADVILLLVSASFIASDYCWDEEMRRALERHARGDARVVPIIVRSCDWKDSPLAQLQVLPTNGTAVTSWINTDEAWSNVAQSVRDVIDELRIDLGPTDHRYKADAPSPGQSTLTDSIASLRARSLSEKELLDRVPELAAFSDGATRFTMTEFEIPEHQRKFRGWWADHLNALVVNGKISQWRRAEGDALIVSARHEGSLRDYHLGHSRVLDSSSLMIESCTPFRQDPVPGSSITPGEIRYPDLPIRSDYLGLVETTGGDHLLSLLKRGDLGSLSEFRSVVDSGQNEKVLYWDLLLQGRDDPVSIKIRLDGGYPHKAHMMVWPSFRSATGDIWRAYYMFHRCTDIRIVADTLWLQTDPGGKKLRRRVSNSDQTSYPLNFDVHNSALCHTGGPPLALVLRNADAEEELGVYLIPLTILSSGPGDVSLAVDFRSSKTVSAVQIDDHEPKSLEFFPELARNNAFRRLTLHICENREEVEGSFYSGGIVATGLWLPTYTPCGVGSLPSALLFMENLLELGASSVPELLPMRDLLVAAPASGGFAREDLGDHIVTGFAWGEASSSNFRMHHDKLREHYLCMFLELAMAEVVFHHIGRFPSSPVSVTFTYPLRSTGEEVERFQRTLRRVIRRSRGSLGISLELHEGVGIYDQSRTSCLSTQEFGEVFAVCDLGAAPLRRL